MNRLLYADLYRMYGKKRFWAFAIAMFGVGVMFILMQYTAMDYEVALDRVIFLPMSFYGMIAAALVSFFVGEDFSDGVIRSKLIAGRSRSSVYFSNLFTVGTAGLALYFWMVGLMVGMGIFLFENNVTGEEFMKMLGLGALTCLAMCSLFGMISMLKGEKATSVMVCMAVAFTMLFLCLHTHQIIVQPEYKDGVLNPHFARGIRRFLYEILHDLNPMGQAAQLSAMDCLNPWRWVICDVFWIVMGIGVGNICFQKKDIR